MSRDICRKFIKYDMTKTIEAIEDEIKDNLKLLKEITESTPTLNIITYGNDMASKVYVRNKIAKCEEFGIKVNHIKKSDADFVLADGKPKYSSDEIVVRLWEDTDTTIPTILQLPIDSKLITEYDKKDMVEILCPPHLDVDGFNAINIGYLINKNPYIMPCTVYGIMKHLEVLRGTKDFRDLKVCVIGRSPIVGFPLIMQLIANNAQVSHINSTHKIDLLKAAETGSYPFNDVDVIISAVGKYGIIDGELAKAIINKTRKSLHIIDVGINRDENNKLVGDFKITEDNEYELEYDTAPRISYTPVPGGIGKLTVLGVVLNTLKLSIKNEQDKE